MMEWLRRLFGASTKVVPLTSQSGSWNGLLHEGAPVVFGTDWGVDKDSSGVMVVVIKNGEAYVLESFPLAQLQP